mmetsp:Transcript_9796/g.16264  ORF Transcript_9796/g.16264 Transcript_9796/m.16264 type:complete len:186 (-) Transcript_9796:469-1026(-)
MRLQYMPFCSSNSLWLPCSTTRPSLTTAIVSACRIVESLCAIMTLVRCSVATISSSAACTTFSLALSSADVASSKSSTAGCRTRARAIATRCFCPPDSFSPRLPTCVPYPSARLSLMKPCAFAMRAAASTSASVAPSLPYAMFTATEPLNSTGSCATRPSCCRSQRTFSVRRSTPSKQTEPLSGS